MNNLQFFLQLHTFYSMDIVESVPLIFLLYYVLFVSLFILLIDDEVS